MFVFLLLFIVGSQGLESTTFPETCLHLDNAAFVGGNIYRRPFAGVQTPMECCHACLKYKGRDRCVGYTFYYNRGRPECWLKRNTAITQRMPFAVSGFPNFYYNATYPDLSLPEMGVIRRVKDLGRHPLKVTLDFVGDQWKLDASVGGLPIQIGGRQSLPEGCSGREFQQNLAAVGANVYDHPIFNLKCPEDCLQYCREFKEQSGRYSCRAVNFITNLEVTECYLKADPMTRIPRPGVYTASSGLDGFKVGTPPTRAAELIKIYHELLNEAKCFNVTKPEETANEV